MKEYPSPDELDSLGYAFMEIQKEYDYKKNNNLF